MPTPDLNNSYKNLTERISALSTFNDSVKSEKNLKTQQQSSLENNKTETLSPLSQLTQQRKRFQRNVESQLEKLININKLIPDNRYTGKTSSSTTSYAKDVFTEALVEVKGKMPKIIVEELLKQLGCSQEQTYALGPFYIPVESVDLFGYLKETPESPFGKMYYEKNPIDVQKNPFSMNRELYHRIQNPGLSYVNEYGNNYLGQSLQSLMDITYVQQDGLGNQGNFYKVDLTNRQGGTNIVGQFLVDYFNTIEILETKNIILNVMEAIFGAISINLNSGQGKVYDFSFLQTILLRILGLCFDETSEIDVSGIAKVAPLDGVDNSFFELTDLDLRLIETRISNIKLGVFEYLECTEIKQPLNTAELFDALLQTLDLDDNNGADNTLSLNNALDAVKNNLIGPKFQLSASIDEDALSAIPLAVFSAAISPKVLLPFMVLQKAISGAAVTIDTFDLETFLKKYQKFSIQVMSKIGALFVKILRDIIVRDIRKLLKTITRELKNSQITKRYEIISSLIELSILLTEFITDYRKCKSVVDDILNIIEFALRGSRFDIPKALKFLARFRSGFSDERAFLEVINEFQKLGLPVGTMPDGSPNLTLLAFKNYIKGTERERNKNGKVVGVIPPLIMTPIGTTIPEDYDGLPA